MTAGRAAAAVLLVALIGCGGRTWIDGWPVALEEHCHDEACRAAVSHAESRLGELEPDDLRTGDGSPVGALGGRHRDRVVVLSLADGTSRITLVSCGRMLDEPIGCLDRSLAEVEAVLGDQ